MAEKKGYTPPPEVVIQGVKPGSKEEAEIWEKVKAGRGSVKGKKGQPSKYEERGRETH